MANFLVSVCCPRMAGEYALKCLLAEAYGLEPGAVESACALLVQRGEEKQWQYFECAVPKCGAKKSKRQTHCLGHDADGKPIRVCKSHKLLPTSPGVGLVTDKKAD